MDLGFTTEVRGGTEAGAGVAVKRDLECTIRRCPAPCKALPGTL
jgi:hypothetical protein